MKNVTVIIINWNGKKILSECLEGLKRQTYLFFSTIVVDNGSTDGSADFISENFPEIKLIALKENLGFAAANNAALKIIKTKYVALLNNDAIPENIWLEKLVKALNDNSKAGFAASKMVFHDNTNVIDRVGDAYTDAGVALLRGRCEESEKFNQKEWIFGACAGAAIYRMDMLQQI